MKKYYKTILIIVALLLILFTPIPRGAYKDGGTRIYSALTYKLVRWSKIVDSGVYKKTRVYFFADAYRSYEELWEKEAPNVEQTFRATVVEKNGDVITVEPLPTEEILMACTQFQFSTKDVGIFNYAVGDILKITFRGEIQEMFPAQIQVTSWEEATELRDIPYPDEWLSENAKQSQNDIEGGGDFIIEKIYSDCIIASTVRGPYYYKFNGKDFDDWCVGDQVYIAYKNGCRDGKSNRYEVDVVSIEESTYVTGGGMKYKPVIYLYPKKTTKVSVKLELDGEFTCTYPAYEDGWKVTAKPDGTLKDSEGQTYNYLYWEGKTKMQYDFSKGFCVKGEDTAAFLEEALENLGLNRKEANEFIVYWLPLMQDNPYNIIAFQTAAYEESAKLVIKPKPDTVIRVFMGYYPSDTFIELEEQELTAPKRKGFTVVEWGGSKCEW